MSGDQGGTTATKPRSRLKVLVVTFVGALVIAVPLALASHTFTDVPDANPFHADITAIALAGITTGKTCDPPGTPPTYCPGEGVTREAMAAFMRRGFGRVARGAVTDDPVGTTETPAIATYTITPGLPAGALAGAAGFIKADAGLTVYLTNATGCPCTYRGALFVTGVGYLITNYVDVTLTTVGERRTLAITGAAGVGTPGAKTVEIRLFRLSGSGSAIAHGNSTATYYPFGSTGGNTLAAQSLPGGPTSVGD